MAWIRTPIALFLIATLAIGGVAIEATVMHGALRDAYEVATDEAIDLAEVERLRALRERVSRKTRTFLLTGNERFVQELRASEQAFNVLLGQLHRAATTPAERALLERLAQREAQRRVVADRLIVARQAGTSAEGLVPTLESDLQPRVYALDASIVELVELHRRDVQRSLAASERTFSFAEGRLWLAAAIALVVSTLTALVLARTLRRIEGRAGRLLRERNRFFELSIDMVCIAGSDGFFRQLNPAFETTLGYTRAELLARPFLDFVHPDDHESTRTEVERLATGEHTIDFENRYFCKDGSIRWLAWHASTEPSGAIYAVGRDVTERKASEEKLAALASELRVMAVSDELTGLHNRRGFKVLAEQHLKQTARTLKKSVFFFADVDGLKQINDGLGHDLGDEAIRGAASALSAAFRHSDIIARLGGDEFVVLATDAASDEIATLTDRVHEAVRQFNSETPKRRFALAISIGSTLYDPEEPETIDAILKRADEMMYAEKTRRKAAAASRGA